MKEETMGSSATNCMYGDWFCPKCGSERASSFCAKCGEKTIYGMQFMPRCGRCKTKLACIIDKIGEHEDFCGGCGLPYEEAVNYIKSRWYRIFCSKQSRNSEGGKMSSWMWITYAIGLLAITVVFIVSEFRFRKTDRELREAIKKLRQWQARLKQRRIK